MELYLSIFKFFLDKDVYLKYKDVIDLEFLRNNYPELFRLFKVLEHVQKVANGVPTRADIQAGLQTLYPNGDQSLYEKILHAVFEETSADPAVLREYLDMASRRTAASKAAFILLDFAEGKVSSDVVDDAVQGWQSPERGIAEAENEVFVSDDIEVLYEKAVKAGGLNWRLDSLNRSLGPLRKGDFGFIFARPESGKTTFLASEVSFMAAQAEGPVLWINNEEQGEKVGIRCYESALNAPLERLVANRDQARAAYLSRTKGNIRIKDDAGISRVRIEKLCELYRPSLIVIDQLDKVQGFDAEREDLRMGTIYQWARELAKRFAPVIGVSQADGSGEGIKYLTMGNVANAKTAKQAEADWILGIGLSYSDPPNVRGFSVCKNKLLGGEQSISKLRHGKWDVLIEPEVGRYKDVAGYGTGSQSQPVQKIIPEPVLPS